MEEKKDKFDWIDEIVHEGFRRVRCAEGYNFINAKNNLLSKKWFPIVFHFSEGFALVQCKNKMWNFLNAQGKLLVKEGFFNAKGFFNGYATVQRKDKLWNFLDKDGNILSKEWFSKVECFLNGMNERAIVIRENEQKCFLDKKGQLYDWKTEEVIKEKE